MLHDYEAALAAFETKLSGPDWRATMRPVKPLVSGYATRTWGFHD
jgi:hypothetical protein